MTTETTPQPVWAQAAFVNAFWVATSETPEWIAAHTDALLTRLGSALGVSSWQTYKGDHWEGSPENLANIVRRFIDRDAPTADYPDGEPLLVNGYTFSVSGEGPGIRLSVRVAAGSIAVGRRVPSHTLSIDLRETTAGAVTSELGDILCSIVAQEWQPAALELADTSVALLARRGNWKIGIGYRTWISAQVAAVTQVADGLTMSKLAGGTLISAPDDWPAARVVEAMTATLRANGLDEVPH
ncbi:hypothetical protein [Mycobacteroides abscessus]|uniref:hypothetical protein n=1 Tax=Mycobacteroides abscessus TaxID=36809 RepID=UPI001F36A2F6|nr:hypothetical protein [Mycobacteroides abscessus]